MEGARRKGQERPRATQQERPFLLFAIFKIAWNLDTREQLGGFITTKQHERYSSRTVQPRRYREQGLYRPDLDRHCLETSSVSSSPLEVSTYG